MRFLFDTDHNSFLQDHGGPEHAAIAGRMSLESRNDFAVSVVSFHEQVRGANAYFARARSAVSTVRAYALISRLLRSYSKAVVLPFDNPAAATFGRMRDQRCRIGTMDLRIASIALAHGLTLLTRNLRDFRVIPGLDIEDWTV